jgi:urease accessory protein
MILINDIPHLHNEEGLTLVPLKAERLTLAKKRWRGYASDGQEFGFELSGPVEHGTPFHRLDQEIYVIEQKPETLLELPLPQDPMAAAELGWKLGNLHIPIQITATQALLADDPGMRQNLERQHLHFHVIEGIFRPLRSGGHGHHHQDHSSCGHEH